MGVGLAREHMCPNLAAERKYRAEIDLQNLIPVVIRELVRGMAALDSAAVEQNIDLLAIFQNLRHESGHG